MTKQLLHNSIQCPDGTILTSKSQHGYQEHTQEDGRWYMVDGGLSYARRSMTEGQIDLSVYTDDPHLLIREHMEWTSYGIDGKGSAEVSKIKDITGSHLIALVEWTEEGYPDYIHKVFVDELEYRLEKSKE